MGIIGTKLEMECSIVFLERFDLGLGILKMKFLGIVKDISFPTPKTFD